jgi:hypothetical protein
VKAGDHDFSWPVWAVQRDVTVAGVNHARAVYAFPAPFLLHMTMLHSAQRGIEG